MPFGKLMGIKIMKKKPEPEPVPEPVSPPIFPEPAGEPEPVPGPEPIPEPEPVPEPASPPADPAPVYAVDLQILMAGRTLGIQREYLAAMKDNLTQMLTEEGLAFYIRDFRTITELVDVSKKLGEFFFRFSRENWTYPADDAAEASYEFSISPAGRQKGAVHIGVHCVTPAAGDVDVRGADAVWLAADGPMWTGRGQDGYVTYLRGILSCVNALAGREIPVVLLQAQIEGTARFRRQGTKQTLKAADQEKLDACCRALFGGSADPGCPVAMIPVQLYDGLEYAGTDAQGMPYLRLSEDGYHQMYNPVNCQIPVLYTLQAIAEKRKFRLFEDDVRGGFPAAAERHCERVTGKKGWKPSFLWEESAARGGVPG